MAGKFLAKTTKVAPRGVIHSSIQRRPREGTDTGKSRRTSSLGPTDNFIVPVFNSTAHFVVDPDAEGPSKPRSKAEDVLTQRAKVDPSYTREIPQGSLVAVHSTASLYTSSRGQKSKFLSFNLLAVQILALPKDA